MSAEPSFREKLAPILAADDRYRPEAYEFVAQSVTITAKVLRERSPEPLRHISGQQLLEGIRELALAQFGCLTLDVLTHWGLRETMDVGNVVFNLVHHQLLGASEQDSPQDFADVYRFDEVFGAPFRSDPGWQRPALPVLE